MDVSLEKRPVVQNAPRKVWECMGCGECCHIRERDKISAEDELKYKEFMKSQFGIFYLATLSDVTINIWPQEAELLRTEAKKRGMNISIRPKRALVTPQDELIVMDYFIDHDVCPFFDKEKKNCTVYDIRPLICRAYPLTSPTTYGKCKYKTLNLQEYGTEMDFAKELQSRLDKEKAIITDLMLKGMIIREFGEKELLKKLDTLQFRELRLK